MGFIGVVIEMKKEKKLNINIDGIENALWELHGQNCLTLIVGGAVRDAVLGVSPKDIDFEVYNSSYDELAKTLAAYGKVDIVGKSFGVIKLTTWHNEQFDFSIPRIENKNGIGHKSF